MELNVDFILDAHIKHWGTKCYWNVIDKDLENQILVLKTLTTNQYLATGMYITNLENKEVKFVDNELIVSSKIIVNSEKKIIDRLVINDASKTPVDVENFKKACRTQLFLLNLL